jgi:dienelactone hydrolase
MKTFVAIVLLCGFAAFPAAAQEGEQQKSPFTPEEGKMLGELEQAIRQAFDFKKHDEALAALQKQAPIFEAGLARVEKGEVDYGEQKPMAIAQLREMTAGNYYNQACCLSLLGRKEEAIKAISRAMELGWLDVDHMKVDKDLDPIRDSPEYKALIDGLNYNDVFETYAPEGVAETAAVVLVLHPDESNEKATIERFKPLADAMKFVIVAPRAPYTMAAERFAWGRKSDDEEAALKKISATIDAVKGQRTVDPAKLVLLGARRGGYFAVLFALSKPETARLAITANAFWNKYYFADFMEKAKAAGVKVCFIHGKQDPFFGKSEDGLKQLTAAGVASKLVPYDGGSKLPDDLIPVMKEALTFLGL